METQEIKPTIIQKKGSRDMLSKHVDREFDYLANKLNTLMRRTLNSHPQADIIIHDGYILLVKKTDVANPYSKENVIAKHTYVSGKTFEERKPTG